MTRQSTDARTATLSTAAAAAFLFLFAGGCSSAKPIESTDDGQKAARHAAQADAAAQAASGEAVVPGTTSSLPSLMPGEGGIQRPIAAVPATAPPPDKFDNDDAGHLLARCRDRSARHEWFDAIGDCRRSAELDPSSIEPHVELMRLLVTLQSYKDAEESARRVLAAQPNDAVALYYLAWSHRGRDEFPEAIDALQRAIALDPARPEFVQALAVTYRLSGDYGKSLATLERALALRPGDAKIQGMIAQTRSDLAERLAPYHKLVKEKPDSYDNHAALAFMYQKYGLTQKALTAYDTSLQMIPTPLESQSAETKKLAAQIYYNRGVVYRDLGRPEIAEPALLQSIALDPSLSSFAWYMIGLCRYDSGKYDTSIDALQKSIELAPNVADNRSALADAYEKAGERGDAQEQRNAVAAIRAREEGERAERRREEAAEVEAARQNEKLAAPSAGAAAAAPSAGTAPAAPSAGTAPAVAPLAASGTDAPED